jgi:serine/threonine-protein kinase HipA
VSYGDFLRVTRRLTLDQREVFKAFKICAFNVLMNNRDDHAKNLAFVREDDGRWLLAPPYDLTYSTGVGGEHFMDIAGEGKTPERKHLLATAAAAGLDAKVAEPVLDELLDQVTPDLVQKLAKEMPLKAATVATVVKTVTAHHARLRGR